MHQPLYRLLGRPVVHFGLDPGEPQVGDCNLAVLLVKDPLPPPVAVILRQSPQIRTVMPILKGGGCVRAQLRPNSVLGH